MLTPIGIKYQTNRGSFTNGVFLVSKNSRKSLSNTNGLSVVFVSIGAVMSVGALYIHKWEFVPLGIIIIGLGVLTHVGVLCLRELVEINEGHERDREA